MFGQVMAWLMYRDLTKWYTFSCLDLILMASSGLIYLFGDEEVQPPVVFWLFIIGCNTVISWLHNRNNDEADKE